MPRHSHFARSATIRGERSYFLSLAREANYEMSALARNAGISERTVQRTVRRLFDRVPEDWFKEQKLLASLIHLAETGSVKQAAIDSGFKQASHYTREFKKTFRMTPTDFLAARSLGNVPLG